MQKSYESHSEKDSTEATDHETSSLTTTSILDYIKETIKSCSTITVHRSYSNLTNHNLPTSLQETLSVDHNCGNTLWKNSLYININNPSVIPTFKTKHGERQKNWLCCPVNEIYPISLL